MFKTFLLRFIGGYSKFGITMFIMLSLILVCFPYDWGFATRYRDVGLNLIASYLFLSVSLWGYSKVEMLLSVNENKDILADIRNGLGQYNDLALRYIRDIILTAESKKLIPARVETTSLKALVARCKLIRTELVSVTDKDNVIATKEDITDLIDYFTVFQKELTTYVSSFGYLLASYKDSNGSSLEKLIVNQVSRLSLVIAYLTFVSRHDEVKKVSPQSIVRLLDIMEKLLECAERLPKSVEILQK